MIGESNEGACFEMGMGWRVGGWVVGCGGETWLIWVFLLMHGSGISGGESLSVCLDYGIEREREMEGILYVCMTNLPSRKYVEALGIAFRQANVVNIRTTAVIYSCKREKYVKKETYIK